MFLISHENAFSLEHIVRRAFNCDRFGVSGLANADHFEKSPLDAAIMIISALYACGKVLDHNKFDEFISDYSIIFNYPEENLTPEAVSQYITDLRNIVQEYF